MKDGKKRDSYREFWGNVSEQKLLMMRNLSYGGSGFCVALLIVLVQISSKDVSLEAALIAVCVAMPCWIAAASMYESYIFLGAKAYGSFLSDQVTTYLNVTFAIAALGVLISLSLLIWHLSGVAFACFGAASIAALTVERIVFSRASRFVSSTKDLRELPDKVQR